MQNPFDQFDSTAPTRRPLVINGPPREAPMQAPVPEALDRARLGQMPLQAEQTRTSIASQRANMSQIPLQNQNTQTNIQQGQTSIRTSLQQAQQSLRDDYFKQKPVQDFTVIVPQYAAALRASKGHTKAADLDLVNAFAKILDPPSVVRESEVQSASNVGSVNDQAQAYRNSIMGRGTLDDAQRAEIVAQIRNRASAAADAYNQTRSFYTGLAQRNGYSPDDIVGPHAAQPFQQIEADYYGHPIKNGTGFTYPKGYQGPRDGQPPAPNQPFNPYGEGDIGFNNRAEVAALPPRAMEAQRDVEQQIQAGKLRSFADVSAYVKQKYGYDTPMGDKEEKAVNEAIAHGRPVNILTPQFQKPDIKDMRGSALSNVPIGIGPTAPTLQQVDAGVRGAADTLTMGFADEAGAALDSIFGGGTMRGNLARQRAIDDFDAGHNAPERMVGQAAGAAMLPTGEINTAADLAKMGGAYGAAYGFGSGRGNIGDRLMGAAEGGAAGAGTSAALGGLGNVALRSLRGRPGSIPPLVDPATGSLNQPLESATAGERVAAAKKFGIDLPMDAAGDRTAAIIGKGLDMSPASAGLMNDARRGTEEQVQQAAGRVAGSYGQSKTLYEGGQAAQRGPQSWVDRAFGPKADPSNRGVSGKLYDAIPIPPAWPSTLTNTRNALGEMIDVFRSNPKMREMFQNGKLRSYLEALTTPDNPADEFGTRAAEGGVLRTVGRSVEAPPGELSWKDINHFRSIIGEEIGEQRFSDSPLKSQLRRLYGSLSEDMRATAQAHSPQALRAFDRANGIYHQMEQRVENDLTSILGDDARKNPEAAALAIQKIAKGGGNLNQLQAIRASSGKGGDWNEVASSLIRVMGQPAKSEGRDFNPQTFINNYADMSEPARHLLFGDRGRAELRQALDQFVAVNQRLAGVNALRNTSQTTPTRAGMGAVAGISSTIALAPSHPLAAAGVAASAAGTATANYGLAKLWTNPAFVRWATGYTKIAAGGNPAAVASQIGRLRTLAAKDPTIREPALALERSLMSGNNGNDQTNGQ